MDETLGELDMCLITSIMNMRLIVSMKSVLALITLVKLMPMALISV
jgi:hypothetical protein